MTRLQAAGLWAAGCRLGWVSFSYKGSASSDLGGSLGGASVFPWCQGFSLSLPQQPRSSLTTWNLLPSHSPNGNNEAFTAKQKKQERNKKSSERALLSFHKSFYSPLNLLYPPPTSLLQLSCYISSQIPILC